MRIASKVLCYATFVGISESSLLLLLLTASVHLECAKFRGKGRSAISYRVRCISSPASQPRAVIILL